jgi:hypothetical protein
MSGYIPPTYDAIRASVVARWKTTFGANADSSSDTVDGLLLDLASLGGQYIGDELAENYNQGKFATSTGLNVDALLALFLNERRQATPTTCEVWLYGVNGTSVPALSGVATIDTGVALRTSGIVNIADGVYFVMTFADMSVADTITTTIGAAVTNTNTSGTAAVVRAAVAFGLLGNANVANVWAVGTQTDGRTILLVQKTSTWGDSVSGGNAEIYPATLGFVEAVNTGPQGAAAGTITRITTPVTDWEGVVNIIDASPGTRTATDAEYKETQVAKFQGRGLSTARALAGQLLYGDETRPQIPGVTAVRVYENKSNETVSGRPPHSFEAVVLGGDQNLIAERIWLCHPVGIESYGSTSILITDEQGLVPQPRIIKFSRPLSRYAWARISITPGEGFPSLPLTDIQALISGALEAWGDALGIGGDIYVAQVSGVITNNLAGCADVQVELAVTPTDVGPPTYGFTSITIGEVEISEWSATRVEVYLV